MLEIIDKGLTTRAHETPLLFVHGGHHAARCWNEREPRRSAKSCLLTHVRVIGTATDRFQCGRLNFQIATSRFNDVGPAGPLGSQSWPLVAGSSVIRKRAPISRLI